MKSRAGGAVALLLASWSGTALLAQQAPPIAGTRFQTTVEVTSLDVTVVDSRGRPVTDLSADAFTVRVDNRPRRVLSADWVSRLGVATAAPRSAEMEGYSTNVHAGDGRLVLMVVDQPNIRSQGIQPIRASADAFVDRLQPADRVAVVGWGVGAPRTGFTADRAKVKAALAQATGQKRDGLTGRNDHQITGAEAVAIMSGDLAIIDGVAQRECRAPSRGVPLIAFLACRDQIQGEAQTVVQDLRLGGQGALLALRELLQELRAIDGPKTMILLTEGFPDEEFSALIRQIGALTTAAQTTVHVVQTDAEGASIASDARPPSPFIAPDERDRTRALEKLVEATNGELVRLPGSGSSFFERLEAELSGYYLLGVEPDARDRDGRPHQLQVVVRGNNHKVRARPRISSDPAAAATPRQAVLAGLNSPLALSALPLRLATFTMGQENGKVQLLIDADIGREYASPSPVSIAYVLLDASGRMVEGRTIDPELSPAPGRTPGPLRFVANDVIPPGIYTMKLVVAEGRRVGSVEHEVRATLHQAGGLTLSELVVGRAAGGREDAVRTTAAPAVPGSGVRGYLEVTGQDASAVKVRYEIAAGPAGTTLVGVDARRQDRGSGRSAFEAVLPDSRLPPGRYLLRAKVANGTGTVTEMTRTFELPTRAPREVAIDALAAASRPFLRPFRAAEALTPEVVAPFRRRVAVAWRPAFDAGLAALGAGEFGKAELALKAAVRPEVDSTAPLTYLAAAFAANGRDIEAAAAWQTALVDGSSIAQIYDWLARTLIRLGRLPEARALLAEALGAWPNDTRFVGLLVAVEARDGKPADAAAQLERYLTLKPGDLDALHDGVEWLYLVHASGAVVRSAAEDLALARRLFDAYAAAQGADTPLVSRWVEFIAGDRR